MRREIRSFLKDADHQPGFDDAVLAAHELISNAIEYGTGTIVVTIHVSDKGTIIAVDSAGDPFGMPAEGALAAMDLLSSSGRGLIIAQALCPQIELTRDGGRTRVVATLPVSLEP